MDISVQMLTFLKKKIYNVLDLFRFKSFKLLIIARKGNPKMIYEAYNFNI